MQFKHWGGLRSKVITLSFVPTAIFLAAVALVGFYAYQQVIEDQTLTSSRELARLSADQLAAELSDYAGPLTSLARTAAIYTDEITTRRSALAQASNRLAIFDGGVIMLNHYGLVVAAQPPRPEILGQDWSSREYFKQMIRVPGMVLSNVVNDGPGGTPVVLVAVPVINPTGDLSGTLLGMFRVDPGSLNSFYAGIVRLRFSAGEDAYLVDRNGVVIYHTNADWIGQHWSTQPIVQAVNAGQSDARRTRDTAGREIVASFAPVPGTTWGLVTEQNWAALLARGQNYGQFLISLLALGLVVPAVVVLIGVGKILEPIGRLITATQAVASGELGHRTTVKTGDEIEELSNQFNRMSERLAESYTALREREERLALVVQGTNEGIWDWDLEANTVYYSPRWKEMLGYRDDEIPNNPGEWGSRIHPDDLQRAIEQRQAYLDGKIPVYQLEHRLRHKDGSYRWILARGIVLRHPDGKPYRMAGSHTDITERKRADEAVRQSEKRFSQVFAASPLPITITTLVGGRYVEVNDAWLRLYGYERDEVIGRTALELNVWAQPEQRLGMIAQLEDTGSLRNFEHLTRTKSGAVRDVVISAEIIEQNDEHYNLSIVYDITDRKQAQQALELRVAERTHELATLNTIAEVVSRSLDLREIMGAALLKALEVMRMDNGTAYSLQDSDDSDEDKLLIPTARYGLSDEFAQRVGSRRVRGTAIQIAAQKQQPLVWSVDNYPDPALGELLQLEGVRQVINVPLFAKGKFVGIMNLGTRHERVVTPEELTLLGAIGHQVAIAVENAHLYDRAEQSAALAERTRLARELHDSVTQQLYSVTLYAEAAQLLLTSGDHATAAGHLRELRDTAREALGEMRLLIFELRPLALEKQGLAEALQERLETVEARGGIKPDLRVQGAEQLSRKVQQEFYHIAREALNNVVKHAHAHHVRVALIASFAETCLEIADDGAGFDPAALPSHGLGLVGIKERVQRIGGTLEIVSAPGQGTTVRVRISGEPNRQVGKEG